MRTVIKLIILGGIYSLLMACPTKNEAEKSSSSQSSSAQVIKDTLPGVFWAGFDDPNPDTLSSSVVDLYHFGPNLIAHTENDDLFMQVNGKWNSFKLPNNEKVAYWDPFIAIDNQSFYILGEKNLWKWNIQAGFVQVPLPKQNLWCPPNLQSSCVNTNILKRGNELIVASLFPYNDALLGQENIFFYKSTDDGLSWTKIYNRKLNTLPNSDRIRNFYLHKDTLWIATWERGVWFYDGLKWDSIPYYIDPITSDPNIKYTGITVLNNQVFASTYGGDICTIDPKSKTMNCPHAKRSNSRQANFFIFGIDTVCGQIVSRNAWEYFTPGGDSLRPIFDTTLSQYAYKAHNEYPRIISQKTTALRMGDTMYIATTGRQNAGLASRKGGVWGVDLRQMPWCTEAWNRGKSWRDSISTAQKLRNQTPNN